MHTQSERKVKVVPVVAALAAGGTAAVAAALKLVLIGSLSEQGTAGEQLPLRSSYAMIESIGAIVAAQS